MKEPNTSPTVPLPMTLDQFISLQRDRMLNIALLTQALELELQAETNDSAPGDIRLIQDANFVDQAIVVTSLLGRDCMEPSYADFEVLSSAIAHLNNEIANHQRGLLSLQLQVNRILRDMQRFKGKVTDLHQQRKFFKAYLSPVRRLPAEVLSHIFSYLADEEIVPPTIPSLRYVMQVCRSWRNACLGCAGLWRSLAISGSDTDGWMDLVAELAPLWFANSKDLPLRFSLKAPHPDGMGDPSEGILDSIFPYIHRITELRIFAYDVFELNSLFRLPPEELSSLEVLSLLVKPDGDQDLEYSSEATMLFSSVPHLRMVVLNLHPIKIWQSSEFPFPWAQITSLDILQVLRFDEWLSIFCQCANLETASFVIDATEELSPPSSQAHIVFKNLAKLAINFEDGGPDIGRLETLQFPALRDLSIINAGVYNVSIDPFLQSFSAPSLTRLCLARVVVELTMLVKFLHACESLEELRIDVLQVDQLLEALNIGIRGPETMISTPPTLPKLTSFIACVPSEEFPNGNDPVPVSTAQLDELLLSWHDRAPPLTHLKHVTLFVHGYPDFDPDLGLGDDELSRNALEFVHGLRSNLDHCIFDEVECPTGFVLVTELCDTRDITDATPIPDPAEEQADVATYRSLY